MNLESFDRWHRIIRLLQERPRTRTQIFEALEQEEIYTSARTFERDLSGLRDLMGLEIEYNRNKGRYYLKTPDDEDTTDLENRLTLLERVAGQGRINRRIVGFAKDPHLRMNPAKIRHGIDFIVPLLEAAAKRQVIHIRYQSYDREAPKEYDFEPGLVAEWANRWYTLGWYRQGEEVRTFALDRILEIDKRYHLEAESPVTDYRARLEQVYGITFSNKGPQHILIRCTRKQARYLDSMPLHQSQREVPDARPDAAGKRCFSFLLTPNHEFVHDILRMGTDAEVLEPASLRKEVAEKVRQLALMYA